MAIIKRKITMYGTGGHVVLPKAHLGEDAIIVYEDDLESFKNLIRTAYLAGSVYDKKISSLKFEVDDLKARVAFIERVASPQSLGKKGNETQQEEAPVSSQEGDQ